MNIKVGRYGKNEGTVVPFEGYRVTAENGEQFLSEEVWVGGVEFRDDGTIWHGDKQVGEVRRHWQGWIEDEDRTWIAFIDMQGQPVFFLNRCRSCGGVLNDDELHPDGMPGYCHHRHPDGTPWSEEERAAETSPRGPRRLKDTPTATRLP